MRRLVCTEGGASKFWEGRVDGATLVIRFGKLGTAGQTREKTFDSAAAADKELAKVAAEKLRGGYVEEGATAASPPAVSPPAAPPPAAPPPAAPPPAVPPPAVRAARPPEDGAPFPFRYYGARPADWYEGANDGHPFELCFRQAPDEATAERLGACLEATLAAGPVRAAYEPWRWSGRFALMLVGERFQADRFGKLEELFGAMHRIWPLEQVIFLQVRTPSAADRDEWTAWSMAEKPVPTAGPISPFSPSVHARPDDATLPPYAAWPAFEAGRRKQRGQAANAALVAFVAEADGPLRFSLSDEPTPAWSAPDFPALRKNKHDHFVPGPKGRVAIYRVPEHGARPLELADEAGQVRPTDLGFLHCAPVWHPDGEAVFAVGDKRRLARVDVTTGKAETVLQLQAPDEIRSLCGVPAGLVVATEKDLLLFDPRAIERGPTASHRAVGYMIGSVLDGRVLWARALSKDTTAIVAAGPGTLKRLATIPATGWLGERGERVFFCGSPGLLEVHGLSAALEALAGKGAKAASKRPASAKAAPALVPIQAADVIPYPPFAPGEREKLHPDAEWIVRTPTGRVIASNQPYNKYPKCLAWLDDAGEVREAKLEETRFTGADGHPDGTIVVGGTYVVYLYKAGGGEISQLSLTELRNEIADVVWFGDRLAVLAAKGLFLFDRAGKPLGEAKLAKGKCVQVHGEHLVALTEGKDRIVVFEVAGEKLRAVFKAPLLWRSAYSAGGRSFFADATEHWFELVGLG